MSKRLPRFPESHERHLVENESIVPEAMVTIDRCWEHLRSIQKNNWKSPEDHPDLDPAQDGPRSFPHHLGHARGLALHPRPARAPERGEPRGRLHRPDRTGTAVTIAPDTTAVPGQGKAFLLSHVMQVVQRLIGELLNHPGQFRLFGRLV